MACKMNLGGKFRLKIDLSTIFATKKYRKFNSVTHKFIFYLNN